jgi:hypothetical protein
LLTLCATGVYAQTALDSPVTQWARGELAEAQMRNSLMESQRIFARKGSEENHSMVEREWKRARRSVSILLVTCLIIFFVFALPLFEREKVTVADPDESTAHDVRLTMLHER